jgi:8-hydroxy-5-deazaflavin:NADPH oxidoreductase
VLVARGGMRTGLAGSPAWSAALNRTRKPAVLFYVTDDDRADKGVQRLIRTAGFEPVKADEIEQSGRLEVGGDLHDLVVGLAEARSLIGMA